HAISTDQFGGPDAIGVLGIDGGGQKSPTTLPTMTQIPMVVKQVKVPVLASGNIGDGRGLLAALIMGAEGVILGTAFMALISVRHIPIFAVISAPILSRSLWVSLGHERLQKWLSWRGFRLSSASCKCWRKSRHYEKNEIIF
ncbi:nitronate monooxygenase, partial [PVC group bacterium]|nr:nitronate monooxygenase [PVC group bacterium]